MSTCAILGQAVGAGVVAAVKHGETPRGVYRNFVSEVQQILMEDDCWLPGHARKISEISKTAKLVSSKGDSEVLRNGRDRPIGDDDNGVLLAPGEYAEYRFDKPVNAKRARFVFDSDLNRETQRKGGVYTQPMWATYYLHVESTYVPKTMTKDFRLILTLAEGGEKTIEVKDNHQRLVYADINECVTAVRFEPVSTWGNPQAHVFAFDVE
jgi:hypothetical protein